MSYTSPKCVRSLGRGWCHDASSSCVCVPVSFPFLQPQQGYTVCISWQQNWWCYGSHRFLKARQNYRCLRWDVQMGRLLLRLLTDTLGCGEHWKVRELLLASIAPASFGFTSWYFCWNLWGLRRPSLVHWPLVGLEDWPYIFCLQPGFKGAALLGRQSAQCCNAQRGHRSICHRNIWSPKRLKPLILLVLP